MKSTYHEIVIGDEDEKIIRNLVELGIERVHNGRPYDDHSLWMCRGRLYITDMSGNHPLDTDDPPIVLSNPVIYATGDGFKVCAENAKSVRISLATANVLVDNHQFSLRLASSTDRKRD